MGDAADDYLDDAYSFYWDDFIDEEDFDDDEEYWDEEDYYDDEDYTV